MKLLKRYIAQCAKATGLVALLCSGQLALGQVKLTQDTINAPVLGFFFGTTMASDGASTEGGMFDLYKNPYLTFGIDASWKFQNNWLIGIDGSLMFGNDNLRDREQRMPGVYSNDATSIVIGANGVDANVTCYNRGLNLRAGAGRIFTLGTRNPNSGIVTRLYGGIVQQKTIFTLNDEHAPQLEGDYARLYDNKRRGFTLTESVGYWFMSNKGNFYNFYVAFELTQSWTRSVRPYVIDGVRGIAGADNTHYFDLLYTIKLCWMFPLKGKSAYDYYFF